MSRLMASALVIGLFGVGSAHAGSLNINPYPNKAPSVNTDSTSRMDSRDAFADKVQGSLIEERQYEARMNNKLKINLSPDVNMTPMPGESFEPVRAATLKQKDMRAPADENVVMYKAPSGPRKINLDNKQIAVLSYGGNSGVDLMNSYAPSSDAVANYRPQVRELAFLTAQPGEAVQDVLRSWADSQNVGFLWKTRTRYAVKESVNTDEGFESSVETLLSQYENDPRPLVAKLNTDPVTGVRTLTVMTR